MNVCKQCGINKKDKFFYPMNKTRCKECISNNNRNKTPYSNEGYIYVITNPAWKGYYKIGQTVSLSKRMGTYQTSSPLRDFSYLSTVLVKDMNKAEKELLEELKRYYEVKGEWVVASKPEHILHLLEGLNHD
jgi:hypothetical protein